jgi:antitoxin VapB
MNRKSNTKKTSRDQTCGVSASPELAPSHTRIGKEGDQLNTQSPTKLSLLEWLDTLEPLDEDFPEIEDLPPEPVDL